MKISSIGKILRSSLSHPLTRDLDLDDPITTQLRRTIIQQKSFLRKIYQEWYTNIADCLPEGPEGVLELGSGAGSFVEYVPNLITSDIIPITSTDLVLDGQRLPFAHNELKGIVMCNVLHHMHQPRQFFERAARCVRPGGVIVMLEPWATVWSRRVYSLLHHELFKMDAVDWQTPSSAPLSGANGALPWIIFERDREIFEREFSAWHIESVILSMPFSYLLSGGVSLRSFMPGWTYPFWQHVENLLDPWMPKLAMFAQIKLQRVN